MILEFNFYLFWVRRHKEQKDRKVHNFASGCLKDPKAQKKPKYPIFFFMKLISYFIF